MLTLLLSAPALASFPLSPPILTGQPGSAPTAPWWERLPTTPPRVPSGCDDTWSGITGFDAGEAAPALVQEDGIAELDRLVSDGSHLFGITGDRVTVAALRSGRAETVAELFPTGDPRGLFLHEGRLVVVSDLGSGGDTTLSVYDVADPGDPRRGVVEFLGAPAREVRRVADQLVVVTAAVVPARSSTRGFGVPGGIFGCAPRSGGSALANVLTFDLDDGDLRGIEVPGTWSGPAYVGDGAVWLSEPMGGKTRVHRVTFSEEGLDRGASVELPGTLATRFQLSEADGVLRAAWHSPQGSYVGTWTVDGRPLGVSAPMAPRESLMSARFDGDRAYVVTFLRKDPLFVVDLRDAATPTVLGALDITGWSDLIVPIDGGHLLTAGVDEAGAAAVALFDVRNPAAPTMAARATIPTLDGEVRRDLVGWTWDPSSGTLALPAGGAMVPVRVGAGLAVGEALRSGSAGALHDAVVVGDTLWAVGAWGFAARALPLPSRAVVAAR